MSAHAHTPTETHTGSYTFEMNRYGRGYARLEGRSRTGGKSRILKKWSVKREKEKLSRTKGKKG